MSAKRTQRMILARTWIVLVVLAAAPSFGAYDMYLKISGIPGESVDAGHRDWIDIQSAAHGMTSPVTFGQPSLGKPEHKPLRIVKFLDKASPKLYVGLLSGEHFSSVTLQMHRRDDSRTRFLEIRFRDVVLASIAPVAAGGDESQPTEEVSFIYSRIEWTYTVVDPFTGKPSGTVSGGWDVIANTPLPTTAVAPELLGLP